MISFWEFLFQCDSGCSRVFLVLCLLVSPIGTRNSFHNHVSLHVRQPIFELAVSVTIAKTTASMQLRATSNSPTFFSLTIFMRCSVLTSQDVLFVPFIWLADVLSNFSFDLWHFHFFAPNYNSVRLVSQFRSKRCRRMLFEPPSLRCVLCEAVIFFRDGRWWLFFIQRNTFVSTTICLEN